jgi:hypothetical protein
MLTMSVRLLAEEANPDSAWLSLEVDGYPVLTELEVEKGDTVVLHFMMKNSSDVAHAYMVPLYYGDDKLRFVEAGMDTSTFPDVEKGAWTLSTKTVVENDSSKIMLYAFTVSYASGVQTGLHHLGWMRFEAIDSGRCVIDRSRFGYSGSVLYTNGPQARDYVPNWQKVQ